MKISLQDRELARELAELFVLDEQTMKMLGVVLSSHRQLPADEKPGDPPRPACGAAFSINSSDVVCTLPGGHDGEHSNGMSCWATPRATCLDRDPNYLRRCVLDPGHPGHHGASDGIVWI